MSSPQDPQQGDQPQYPPGTYGTGYGGAIYPYPAGQEQGDQAAGQGYPYRNPPQNPQPAAGYGTPSGYPYPAYGSGPAGLGDDAGPPVRPRIMLVALVCLTVAVAPSLVVGLVVLAVPRELSEILFPPGVLDDPLYADAGLTPDTLVAVTRFAGGLVLAVSLLYVLFAVLAFRGRNWARVLVTVMTVGFAILQLFALVGAAGGALLSLVPLVASIVGVVLLYRGESGAYFAGVRR